LTKQSEGRDKGIGQALEWHSELMLNQKMSKNAPNMHNQNYSINQALRHKLLLVMLPG